MVEAILRTIRSAWCIALLLLAPTNVAAMQDTVIPENYYLFDASSSASEALGACDDQCMAGGVRTRGARGA